MSIKTKRIASSVVKELSDILANESNDSIMKTITITGCDVTNDVSFAKVYFTSLADLPKEQLEKELKEAAGYLRKELAGRLDIRHTPELKFEFDNSIEFGMKIEQIIKALHDNDK